MDSEQTFEKNEISGPLEHLLMLNLDRSSPLLGPLSQEVEITQNNLGTVTFKKKVRFADRVDLSENEESVFAVDSKNRENIPIINKDVKGILKMKKYDEAPDQSSFVEISDCEDQNYSEDSDHCEDTNNSENSDNSEDRNISEDPNNSENPNNSECLNHSEDPRINENLLNFREVLVSVNEEITNSQTFDNYQNNPELPPEQDLLMNEKNILLCDSNDYSSNKEIDQENNNDKGTKSRTVHSEDDDMSNELNGLGLSETPADFENEGNFSANQMHKTINKDSVDINTEAAEALVADDGDVISEVFQHNLNVPECGVSIDPRDNAEIRLPLFSTKRNQVQVVSGIFQKKMERHFKTCLGVSNSLQSNSSDPLKGDVTKLDPCRMDECASRERKTSAAKSKQTLKLNSILVKDTSTPASATKLKSDVFSAWHQTKGYRTTNVKMQVSTLHSKKSIKSSISKSGSDAYKCWKQSKDNLIKMKKDKDAMHLLNKQAKLQKDKQSDKEENDMAFRSWKKQKDEIILKKKIETSKEEQEKQLNSIMDKEIKKKDAELAFFAWKNQKSQAYQIQKTKNFKALEEEKEKTKMKIKRDKEAQAIYYLWLQSKVSSRNYTSYNLINDRPPWTPPGRSIVNH